MVKLMDVAAVVRSKNAGPFYLTLDILFATDRDLERFVAGAYVDADWVAATYGCPAQEVAIVVYAPARAVKITLPRAQAAGSPGDRDVYGAQQHGPLLERELPGWGC